MSDITKSSRRQFLKVTTLGLAATAVAAIALPKFAHADELPHLPESDPTAMALGYKEDATKVDATKFATYKSGQLCSNCKFFQGTDKTAWAPCQLFPGKSVVAKGWCSGFNAKA